MAKINYLALARAAVKIAEDKKCEDVQMLNVIKLTPITNYFVFMTANSSTQVSAVSSAIEQEFKANYSLMPLHRDGKPASNWRVLDYGGLVVHIMDETTRTAYALEKLWSVSALQNKKVEDSSMPKSKTDKKPKAPKTKAKVKPKAKAKTVKEKA
ncbi:MAG: ribosome silencing factor [Elusimicrobia bacterium]|nr:ribosome silencing factor [Elusimicrobiota bacterium]